MTAPICCTYPSPGKPAWIHHLRDVGHPDSPQDLPEEPEKAGRWHAQIRRKGHEQVTKTFAARRDAEVWAREIESEMDRGAFVSRREAETTTLAEVLDRYKDDVTPTKKGRARETSRIEVLKKTSLAARFLGAIRSTDIASYIRGRRGDGVADATVRLEVMLISSVFKYAALDCGINTANPCRGVRLPAGAAARDRRLKAGEAKYLYAAGSELFGSICEFAVETALRQSEILALTWADVEPGRVRIREDKAGDRNIWIPVSSRATAILAARRGEKITDIGGRVFPMSQDRLIRAFRQACIAGRAAYEKDTGKPAPTGFLDDLRFHDLRHEATSRLFEKGSRSDAGQEHHEA